MVEAERLLDIASKLVATILSLIVIAEKLRKKPKEKGSQYRKRPKRKR